RGEDGLHLLLGARRDDDIRRNVVELRLEDGRVPVMVPALLLDDAGVVLDGNVAERGAELCKVHRNHSMRSSSSRKSGRVVSMARPSRSTMRSDCGRDRSSVQLRARNSTRSAGTPTATSASW